MLRGAFPRSARLVALAVAVGLVAAGCGLPRLEDEQAKAPPLPQTSIVYAADGTVLTTLHGEENRVAVPIARIPTELQHATVAIEDERFYDHRGVDLKAVMRALYVNAAEGRITEGGSTITQQYVKNTLIGNERTLDRKVREAALAYQLEEEMSKDEILEGYLNTVYLGEGAYGVQAAAKAYFSRGVSGLDLRQSALLAGLISAPSDFDPLKHAKEARARRNVVLARMREQGYITSAEEQDARDRGLGLKPSDDDGRYPAPYFIDYVRRQIVEDPRFGDTKAEREDLLYTGGLRIYTTLNRTYQRYAEEAVAEVLPFPDDPHAAMTVVDPRNGHIVAMVGGRDYFARKDKVAKVNHATGDGGTG
ncbi:MAG TPA: transglycosylase domain-containing protein, partial [Actinomycetota bacterium]|nr:transglycosylase domain-containing protein [Actinomycetota bacterium]